MLFRSFLSVAAAGGEGAAMRAVTGAIVSSKPCSLLKAKVILDGFHKSSASNLPSSDAGTYLRTAADAVDELREFRRDLLRAHHQHQHQHQHQHEVKVDVEEDLVHSERKRRNKEERRVVKQEQDVPLIQLQQEEAAAVVSKVGISLVPRKKKEEKDIVIIKQEAEEEEEEPEQLKKKRKHAAQELVQVKKEQVDFVDADLGSDKKKKHKKNKRSRDGDNDAQEEGKVEHTKKKQRK